MCNINDVSDDNTVDILSNILSNVLAIMDATRYISLHKCDFKPATFDNISVSSSMMTIRFPLKLLIGMVLNFQLLILMSSLAIWNICTIH